jgi:hypothetical protein
VRTFEHVNLFQSELLRDFQNFHFGQEVGSYFGEVVV